VELHEISDRLELGLLLDRYAGAIDRVDMELLDTVFTPDAWVDYSAFAEYGGFAGPYPVVRAWLEQGLNQSPGHQHLVANREIEIAGDGASGRVMCFNPMVMPRRGGDGPRQIGFHGLWYVDEYLRTGEGWRIASRREERSWSYNMPGGDFPA
jgi:hypothetical protein